jgi:FAD:protein FMN transferase
MVGKLFVLINLLFVLSCSSVVKDKVRESSDFKIINGRTQGTTYNIVISDSSCSIGSKEIDSLLLIFDSFLNTYDSTSELSKLNKAGKGFHRINDSLSFIANCLLLSKKINVETNGFFDPTIKPLIDVWSIYKKEKSIPDSLEVDSVKSFVGLSKETFKWNIEFDTLDKTLPLRRIYKSDYRAQIDVNAIAQGYSVDVVCEFLNSKGVKDYMVEIGGELRTKGLSYRKEPWKIGVEKPVSKFKPRVLIGEVELSNLALATSGNLRKAFELEGKTINHSINPKEGYPVYSNLLSVSVLANTAAEADAYATAFMVMGYEKSREFIRKNKNLQIEAFFILKEDNGSFSHTATTGFVINVYNEN